MKRFCLTVLAVALLFAAGCGDKVHLGGKVTYSDDGSPLGVGTVCFETDSYLARGTLKADGTYVTGSLSEKDGIPPGTYRVYVAGAMREIGVDKSGMPLNEPLIDEKFASGASSGLVMTVDASTKKYDFQVDRYVPQKKKD